MTHNFTATETTYYIAYGDGEQLEGVLEAGDTISTGQPYLETYTDPRTQNMRINALKTNYDVAVAQWQETLRLQDPVAHLADYRWQKETGGIVLMSGVHMQTDRISQSQLTSALIALSEGMIPSPVKWKALSGWVDMTVDDIRAASTEVAEHVAKCFAAEDVVAGQLVTDPTLDVETAFDAAYAGA